MKYQEKTAQEIEDNAREFARSLGLGHIYLQARKEGDNRFKWEYNDSGIPKTPNGNKLRQWIKEQNKLHDSFLTMKEYDDDQKALKEWKKTGKSYFITHTTIAFYKKLLKELGSPNVITTANTRTNHIYAVIETDQFIPPRRFWVDRFAYRKYSVKYDLQAFINMIKNDSYMVWDEETLKSLKAMQRGFKNVND